MCELHITYIYSNTYNLILALFKYMQVITHVHCVCLSLVFETNMIGVYKTNNTLFEFKTKTQKPKNNTFFF